MKDRKSIITVLEHSRVQLEDARKDLLKTAVIYNKPDRSLAVSTEAFKFVTDILAAIDRVFQRGLKKLIDYMETVDVFIENVIIYKTKTPNIGKVKACYEHIDEILEDANINTLNKRLAPTIMGLKVTLLDLVDVLDQHKEEVDLVKEKLEELNEKLDEIISSRGTELSRYIPRKMELLNLVSIIDVTNKDMSKLVDKKVLTDRKTIKELLGDVRNLKDLARRVLELGMYYSMERLEEIHELYEEAIAKLDILGEAVKRDLKIEKRELVLFSDYIKNVAEAVTVTGFLFYLYTQLIDITVAICRIVELERTDSSIVDKIITQIAAIHDSIMSIFR